MTDTVWIVRGDGDAGSAGWEFGLPPALTPAQWPRHGFLGLPLTHGFTIRVPEGFRAKGPEHVALSYFHPADAESSSAARDVVERVRAVMDGGALEGAETDHLFWQALVQHRDAAGPAIADSFTDILDHDHVIVWHTQAQFEGPRCPRPDTALPDGHDGETFGLDTPVAEPIALDFADQAPDRVHIQLGWPLHPVQCSEEELEEQGFGPMVIEIETDVGGVNYGDGNCQIDLENGLLDWACT